jgi:hypothetical protein
MCAHFGMQMRINSFVQNQNNVTVLQGESKKTDTFDIQMNNKGVSFF